MGVLLSHHCLPEEFFMCLLVNIIEGLLTKGFQNADSRQERKFERQRAGELTVQLINILFLMIVISDKNCVFSTTLRHNVRPLNGKQNHLQGRTYFALKKARLNVILERFYITKI